jgi:hypothetical protein
MIFVETQAQQDAPSQDYDLGSRYTDQDQVAT